MCRVGGFLFAKIRPLAGGGQRQDPDQETGNFLPGKILPLCGGIAEGYPTETVSTELHPDVESAVSALRPFVSGLAADGYTLEVSLSSAGSLWVEIVAGPDACEDCLIPKQMFTGMIFSRLNSQGVDFSDLALVYPADL